MRYIDLPLGSYNGNYPPENVLDRGFGGNSKVELDRDDKG